MIDKTRMSCTSEDTLTLVEIAPGATSHRLGKPALTPRSFPSKGWGEVKRASLQTRPLLWSCLSWSALAPL
jgi:hypothetical protein